MKYGSALTQEQKNLILQAGEWLKQMKQNHLITVRGYATFENDEIAYLIDIDKEWYSPKDEK